MTDADTAHLRRIADKQDIHDVIMRFSRGIDRCDEALLRSCFHPDATDDQPTDAAPADDAAESTAD